MNFDDAEIIGIYRFYADDILISEQKNALTEAGRAMAIKSLLGTFVDFADSIAYGVDSSSNVLNSSSTLITNRSLGFEIGRTRVKTSGYDQLSGGNDKLVFQGTIKDANQYTIYEVGLYPSSKSNQSFTLDSELLFNFDKFTKSTTILAGTYSTASIAIASARIGSQMLIIPQGNGTSNYIQKSFDEGSFSNISSMTSQDYFKLAMFNTSNSTAASVKFRFFVDDSNYYTLSFVSPTASGYHIISTQKGQVSITGTPSWNDVTKIRLWSESSQTLHLDGLKINKGDYAIDTTYGMISRAVLSSPVYKPPSIPVNIEYSLIVNFTGGS